MATARTESTTSKKAASKPHGAAARSAVEEAATSLLTPGTIIAERYRARGGLGGRLEDGENVSAVMSAGEAMLAGMAEVSQEMMTFASDRLRQDMESAEDFAKAKSPEDLFDKHCSFARRAAQQYVEETSKLIGMMARIQQSCWAPMQECTKTALHGFNGANGADGEAEK